MSNYVATGYSVTLNQWFLIFQAPWTPKSNKKVPRTPKVSLGTTCGPPNHCKRVQLVQYGYGYNALLL